MRSSKAEIDIEKFLIWGYQIQKIGVIMARGSGLLFAEARADGIIWGNVSGDGCYDVMRASYLGTNVDKTGSDSGKAHPDAETLHEVLVDMTKKGKDNSVTAGLVYQHALSGSRPDWMPGAQTRVVKILNRRGTPKMIYDNNRKAVACRVSFENPPEMIGFQRAVYRTWHTGLAILAATFQANPDSLVAHTVTGPIAPSMPWK